MKSAMRTRQTHIASATEAEFYTVPEAARRLRVSPATIWRLIDGGRLRAYRVGPRGIRIKPADLEALIEPARKEAAMDMDKLGPPPSPAELTRRHAVVARILANRKGRVIAPMTTADLVREARRDETGEDDDGS
ncbi:MAG: helix-turn-helix domain-containing protein [Armatimonadota bacterium]